MNFSLSLSFGFPLSSTLRDSDRFLASRGHARDLSGAAQSVAWIDRALEGAARTPSTIGPSAAAIALPLCSPLFLDLLSSLSLSFFFFSSSLTRDPPPHPPPRPPPPSNSTRPPQEPQEARPRLGRPRPRRQAPQAPRRPRECRRPAPPQDHDGQVSWLDIFYTFLRSFAAFGVVEFRKRARRRARGT